MRTGPEAFMIEPIMYFGLGFLAAALIGLIIVPFVHGRAVRLTVRRLEAATPLSMAEIQADKDQLRAEFAMSTRRLEMSVEQLKNKSTGQLADLGKKNDVINRLKMELGEKAATIFALEARDRGIKDQLRATEDELAVKTGALRETERTLADKESELSKYTAQLTETSATSDSQRIEIVSLKTQVENLKDQVAGLGKEVKETSERYAREKEAGEKATKELAEERGNVANLGTRIGGLERQLATQTTEAEIMGRRIADMELRLTASANATNCVSTLSRRAASRPTCARSSAPSSAVTAPRPRRCAPKSRWPRASWNARARTAPSCSANCPR
jgi:chromosome segregation ATPase